MENVEVLVGHIPKLLSQRIVTMCSFDFIFRKNKQDSAFCVSRCFAAPYNRPSVNEKLLTPSLVPLTCHDGLEVLHT